MTTPTLQNVFDNADQYNNLIPTVALSEGLPPGVQFRIATVQIDHDPNGSDVYKTGRKKVGDVWTNTYSLSKTALVRLLGAAQCRVPAGRLEHVPDQPGLRRYTAVVEQRSMDGEWRPYPGTADLDIESEVDTFRKKIEAELAQHGKLVRERWEGGEKKRKEYTGEGAKGVMEYEVSEFESRLRKFGAAIVETKAILRGIKGILAIKDGYLPAELKRPFVIYWYQFPVGYNPQKIASEMYPGRADTPTDNVGSPSEPSGSHPGPTEDTEKTQPPKPPVTDRMKMLDTLSAEELRELIRDLSADLQRSVPAMETWPLEALKSFATALHETHPEG